MKFPIILCNFAVEKWENIKEKIKNGFFPVHFTRYSPIVLGVTW